MMEPGEVFFREILSEMRELIFSSAKVGLKQIITRVCGSLREVFRADLVLFAPLPEVKRKLNLETVTVAEKTAKGVDPTNLSETVMSKGTISIRDTRSAKDRSILKSEYIKRNKLRSLFAFSISTEKGPLAYMLVGYWDRNKAPDKNSIEMEVAKSLSTVVAARLYEELQSQVGLDRSSKIIKDVLGAAQETGAEVNLFKLDAIMEYMLQICNQQLGCQVANVWFYDQEIDRLVLARDVGSERDKIQDLLKLGQGITGRAAEIRDSVVVENVVQDGERLGRLDWARAGSEIAVPILDISEHKRLLGVLNVEHREVARLNKSHVPLLEKYAFWLALAIRNAEALNEYDALVSLIPVNEDVDSILEQCWLTAKNVADVLDEGRHIISATLRLYDPETKALVLKAYRGEQEPEPAYSTEELTSVNSWVFNKAKEAYVENVHGSWIEKHCPGLQYKVARRKTVSEYCVPLLWGGKPVGTMNFESTKRSGFSFYTRRTIRLSSFQVATAIHFWQLQGEERGKLESAILDYLSSSEIHEIMNKVRDIKGISQEVFDGLQDPVAAAKKTERICDWVLAEADVHGLLATSDTCDVHEVVKEVLQSSRSWRQHVPDAKISFAPFCETEIYIKENKFWVRKTIENILKNAFHALREREAREVNWSPAENARINISTEMKGEFIKILIEDNGIGLTIEQEKKLFHEAFSGWLYSEKIAKKGHGNALLVLRQAIRRNGGEISCQRKKEGAQFIVSFRLNGSNSLRRNRNEGKSTAY